MKEHIKLDEDGKLDINIVRMVKNFCISSLELWNLFDIDRLIRGLYLAAHPRA
jgi:hypothetical protein